jgi:hypothetical protein
MKKTAIVLGIVLLLGGSARACGRVRRCHARAPIPVVYCPPPVPVSMPTYAAPSPQAVATSPQVAQAPKPVQAVQAMPVAAAGVPPAYRYEASPAGPPAYYYTYDESGKLIVQQWADWVFRGGREAGMPRPPMPVIGWFAR